MAVILPVSAYAQTALAGVVKDSSGAVLPGVTVEAAQSVVDREDAKRRSPTGAASTASPS